MRLVGPPAPPPRHATVAAALAAAASHPSGVTFVDLRERETWLSWAEVADRARRAAAALSGLGVRPGDRVALVLRTEPAFLDAFFGAILAGAVPVPLYPPVRLGRLDEYLAGTARLLSVSGARLAVAGGPVRRLLGEALARARPDLGCLDAARLAEARGGGPIREAAPGDLCLVQFSSGSTVDPKPVALTHANLMAQIEALTALVGPTPVDVLVSWLPLYHDMGLVGCLLGAMSYPGPLVLIPPEHFLARPALWLRAMARHRGTISAAPHFAYAYAADRVAAEDLAGMDLSPWRVALDGAEPVTAPALRRFAERFGGIGLDPGALMPCYGLSEAALAVTVAPAGRPPRVKAVDPEALHARGEVVPGRREVVSVGAPVPGAEVEIRGQDGAPLPERRLGRIFVRSPSVMRGYLGDEAGTARALPGGWLDTGDLGFADGGELFVHGRAKDLVIVRGSNHAPEEFEACLEGMAGLRPGCAVALGFLPEGAEEEQLLILAERSRRRSALAPALTPALSRGERNPHPSWLAWSPSPLSQRERDTGLEEAIRRVILERTGVRAHLVRILAPGTLPRTSSGKMRRGEALRRFQSGSLSPPRQAGPVALAWAAARSALALARWPGRPPS
ncbi:MAG TPA: AMP-binding protein [Anaeromyxobacteraceae bacterium]|nr:AMP-binding protein [Anaeromyxobacteraceae bacterium]